MKSIKVTLAMFCTLIFLCVAFVSVIVIDGKNKRGSYTVTIDWNSPTFIGERSGQYNQIFVLQKKDEELPDAVVEEFAVDIDESLSNTDLIRLYGISFLEGSLSELAVKCNTKLYEICNKYYLASIDSEQMSPLIPMAVANVETPDRADTSITYSSLFPSKYVRIRSADAISSLSCYTVIENADNFNALASDHWTRDRGALQMNPEYGTSFEAYNSLMGPSESEILSNVAGLDFDYSSYQAYEARNLRSIGFDDWLSECSSSPGDRHNVRDTVLRFASASQQTLDTYCSRYDDVTYEELICAVAMAHNSGSVWSSDAVSRKVGNWRSGTSAHQYCRSLGSAEFVKLVDNYCADLLSKARADGKQVPMSLSRNDAKAIYDKAKNKGILKDYTTYVTEGRYYEVTYCYPIQVLYAYSMLALVYSGK